MGFKQWTLCFARRPVWTCFLFLNGPNFLGKNSVLNGFQVDDCSELVYSERTCVFSRAAQSHFCSVSCITSSKLSSRPMCDRTWRRCCSRWVNSVFLGRVQWLPPCAHRSPKKSCSLHWGHQTRPPEVLLRNHHLANVKCWQLLKLLHPECFILMYFEKKVTYKEKAGRRGILHRILPKKWEQAGSRFFLTKQVRVHTKRDFHAACFFWQTDETVGRDQWNWVPLNQLCPDTTLCLTSFNFTYLLGLFILIVSLSKAKSMSWALPDT